MEQEVERLRREAMDAQAIAFDERQTLRRVFIKFMTPWVAIRVGGGASRGEASKAQGQRGKVSRDSQGNGRGAQGDA